MDCTKVLRKQHSAGYYCLVEMSIVTDSSSFLIDWQVLYAIYKHLHMSTQVSFPEVTSTKASCSSTHLKIFNELAGFIAQWSHIYDLASKFHQQHLENEETP
jgi:hypothetical protein